ncbi:hypothetical protein HCU01_10380 [Halomonas cupida]|uniref:Uncharacterized protein n=1 Tax=Halomonas cupida TaxID=44933 RepID=A0A1M7DKS3_9GAMM|nr:hypothetical protein [Halomonas cupida]GEN23089.1 hypothetical protein HCU01_10380 [Halomonas cupida]SHL79769.1 hypothetical protein SAMN05660971_01368 [Halomonas cupida]
MTPTLDKPVGHLAYRDLGLPLPVTVLRIGAGYYLGTLNDEGPVSRESAEYFTTHDQALQALASGSWTQRLYA